MSIDRKLLELAAKAAGAMVEFTNGQPVTFIDGDVTYPAWNPLNDDGDALRLAVKLKLDISFGNKYYFDIGPMTFCGEYWDCRESKTYKRFVLHNDDKYAATRRAIPAQQPETRSLTREQERTHLHEDLLAESGEAIW